MYPLPVGSESHSVDLDRWLLELVRRWERYFGNDPNVPLPPERETAALERRLKQVSGSEPRSTSEKFKLDQQLHRFATYQQLWKRQLRLRETAPGPARAAAGANGPGSAPVAPGEGDEIERLHRQFTKLTAEAGGAGTVGLEQFRSSLEEQRRALEAKGAKVEGFEVVEEEGRVKVRARARRRRS